MARRHRRRRHGMSRLLKYVLPAMAVVCILLVGVFGAQYFESRLNEKVENAGKQMTAHTTEESTAQVFMNGQWYQRKNVETLLVIGIDNYGTIASSGSYNNANQADFLILFVRDKKTGENKAIHLNRDTMTDITVLGVTGQAAGTRRAQLALAYNYGNGQQDSSFNTMKAVSNLLYGMTIDHYITVTMDGVAIMNDWAGGVEVEVLDDLTSVDSAFVPGETVQLTGKQALAYVRTRKGLEDSTNIKRMERQRQYASAWVSKAQEQLQDTMAVAQLVVDMSNYHTSDCTVEVLAEFANGLGEDPSVEIYELPGEAVKGEEYMEYYADEEQLQQLILQLFFKQVQ